MFVVADSFSEIVPPFFGRRPISKLEVLEFDAESIC
jgi:hypothetical protein